MQILLRFNLDLRDVHIPNRCIITAFLVAYYSSAFFLKTILMSIIVIVVKVELFHWRQQPLRVFILSILLNCKWQVIIFGLALLQSVKCDQLLLSLAWFWQSISPIVFLARSILRHGSVLLQL